MGNKKGDINLLCWLRANLENSSWVDRNGWLRGQGFHISIPATTSLGSGPTLSPHQGPHVTHHCPMNVSHAARCLRAHGPGPAHLCADTSLSPLLTHKLHFPIRLHLYNRSSAIKRWISDNSNSIEPHTRWGGFWYQGPMQRLHITCRRTALVTYNGTYWCTEIWFIGVIYREFAFIWVIFLNNTAWFSLSWKLCQSWKVDSFYIFPYRKNIFMNF